MNAYMVDWIDRNLKTPKYYRVTNTAKAVKELPKEAPVWVRETLQGLGMLDKV